MIRTPVRRSRRANSLRICAALVLCAGSACAQPQQVRVEPVHDSGQSVTGAFEGWFANPDGAFSLLFGYFNRNAKEELDIPAGENNRIEPNGPDRGQPTHFLARRQWGMFTVTVPKDFGSNKLTWTLTAHGITTVIPASLNPLWEISPFQDSSGNTPPSIGFTAQGPFAQGPRQVSTRLNGTVGSPLALHVWVADDAHLVPGEARPPTPPVTLNWSKFRGPGAVMFSDAHPLISASEFAAPSNAPFHGEATTMATFSDPGEYKLLVLANDWTGEGGKGFLCCWTTATVNVVVSK
jgi:hypothetical protein